MNSRILLLALAALFLAAAASAATINAASCSYADVQAAVNSASSGDTVIVPAGNCTWSSTLTITKGLTLQGAGTGSTTITGNVGSSNYMVKYSPANPALNEPFTLTGLTFNANKNSRILKISNPTMNPINKIRIHNNVFDNSIAVTLKIEGTIYGVVHDNTFNGEAHIDNLGNQVDSWTNLVYIPGSADNWYYEDNIFNICYTADSGGWGGRYSKRYNTYNLTNPGECQGSYSGFYPLFDAHGNQSSGVYTNMGVEIYGNLINNSGNWLISPFLDHRGGKALVFYNQVGGTGNVKTRVTDEHEDSISPPVYNPTDGTPQRPNNGYYWNNRYRGNTIFHAYEGTDIENLVEENDEFFNYNTSFDGTTGIGCGPLASRPAACTTGVGYWATNQSCSSVDAASVGAHPTTPLSGTLYKCTATNTWTLYYTPYTYPHPLRLSSEICTDSDGDGYGAGCTAGADCNDSNASVYSTISCSYNGTSCGSYQLCALNCPQPPAENCSDTIDNDCDNLVDCNDPNCSANPACTPCPPGQIRCNNTCTTPTCATDANCNDLNVLTMDVCSNPGTCNSSCSNTPYLACAQNITQACNCRGSIYSAGLCCNNTYRAQATCSTDSQCDDQNALTNDFCLDAGTCTAECSNTPASEPVCSEGQTTACITFDNCSGTRTCSNGAWGDCVKDNPNCSVATICTEGQTQLCVLSDGCAGTQTCVNNDWTACLKLDPSCPITGITDLDADGVPSSTDCNDVNPSIGLCTGCAVCSAGKCVAGSCPSTYCPESTCKGEDYYEYPASIANSCTIQQGLGTCTSKECTPIISEKDSKCTIPPISETIPLQVLAAAIILVAIGVIAIAWVLRRR